MKSGIDLENQRVEGEQRILFENKEFTVNRSYWEPTSVYGTCNYDN